MERVLPQEFSENAIEVSPSIDASYFLVLKALISALDRKMSLPLVVEVVAKGVAAESQTGELVLDALENRLQIKIGKNIYLVQEALKEKSISLTPESLGKLKAYLEALAREPRYTSPPRQEQEIGPNNLRISGLKSMHATPYVEMIVDGEVVTFIAHTAAYGWQPVSTVEALKKSDRGSKAFRKYGAKIFDEALRRVKEMYPEGSDPADDISFSR